MDLSRGSLIFSSISLRADSLNAKMSMTEQPLDLSVKNAPRSERQPIEAPYSFKRHYESCIPMVKSEKRLTGNFWKEVEMERSKYHSVISPDFAESQRNMSGCVPLLFQKEEIANTLPTISDRMACQWAKELDDAVAEVKQKSAETSGKRPKKTYFCEVCGKIYKQVRDFRAHIATHTDLCIYSCDICACKLDKVSDYIQHLQVAHHQKGLLRCHICQKYFRDKCTLATHLRIHTGEKPFHCEYCDRKFRQMGTYKRHRKIHLS